MRRWLIPAVVLLLASARPSHALIVECANCATVETQLAEYGKMVEQAKTEVSQLRAQLRLYATAVQNTVSIPQQQWAQVQNDLWTVRNLANDAAMITGNTGTMIGRLNANGYGGLPMGIEAQYSQWQQTLGNAANSLGRVLATQQLQETQYTGLQERIQNDSQTAAGQMQAIQAGVEMASLTNTQLNQIQAAITAQSQMVATSEVVAADRHAQEDAALLAFTQGPLPPLDGYQGY